MGEFVDRLQEGRLPRDAVAITFDDGYCDNLTRAKPLLEKHGVPATFFLATAAIGSGTAFWWDELADMILGAQAGIWRSASSGFAVTFRDREAGDIRAWRAEAGASTQRQTIYLETWRLMRDMDVSSRAAALASLREALGGAPRDPEALPMDCEEIAKLLANGLAAIGAHTVNHRALGNLPVSDQLSEIGDSLRMCQELAGDRVCGFAYPYGDCSPSAIESVRACGLRWACSTEAVAVAEQSLYELPRVQVVDWDADALAAAIYTL
jgi:peptidoglycan/xylan/chitin deacetylase (PgdA/CDA1 family)